MFDVGLLSVRWYDIYWNAKLGYHYQNHRFVSSPLSDSYPRARARCFLRFGEWYGWIYSTVLFLCSV